MTKHLYFLITVLAIYSCKKADEIIPNRPPESFVIKSTLQADGKSILLNWTKAKDLDGDLVKYTIFLKDTLVKDLVDTTYLIKNLDYNLQIEGKVIAYDVKKLKTESLFSVSTRKNVSINIPDLAFEKYLISKKLDKDGVENGKISEDDALAITSVDCKSLAIKSLKGIETFLNLTDLNASFNKLDSINISNLKKLKILNLERNSLKQISLEKNIDLEKLLLSANDLKTIDLTKNVSLRELDVLGNILLKLDVSKNSNLIRISANDLEISELSNNTNLEFIFFAGVTNSIIDISKLTKLKDFSATRTKNNIDFSQNVNLEILHLNDFKISILDLTKNVKLLELYAQDTSIKMIDFSNNKSISKIYVQFNPLLKELDISQNTNIKTLHCNSNKIENLKVNNNLNLEYFSASGNLLTELDLRKLNKIETMFALNNKIKFICVDDISKTKTGWFKDNTTEYSLCK